MNNFIKISFLFLLSCSNQKEGQDRSDTTNKKKIVYDTIIHDRPVKLYEYKKIPVLNPEDTIPYPNTYVMLKLDTFCYYREDSLFYKDLLVRTEQKNVYKLENRPTDLVVFVYKDKKISKLQWLKSNFEGDYEYFK